MGHVGLVPPKRTWTGGFVAVGKTASEAMWIYDQCLKIEDAGGVAIEMECVPYKIAEAISKKVKPTVMSMGSGPGCDVEYVFGCDILGSTKGHILDMLKNIGIFNKNLLDYNMKERMHFKNSMMMFMQEVFQRKKILLKLMKMN